MPLLCSFSKARWTIRPFILLLSAAVLTSLHPSASAQLPGYEIVPLGRGNLNRLRLAATIEGTKGLLVLDTGAGGTFLSQAKYSSLLPTVNCRRACQKPPASTGRACRWVTREISTSATRTWARFP